MSNPKLVFGFVYGTAAILLTCSTASADLVPMEQVGPQPRAYSDKAPRSVALRSYAHLIHVAPDAEHKTVAAALAFL